MNVSCEFVAGEHQKPSNGSVVANPRTTSKTQTGSTDENRDNENKEHPAETLANTPLKRLACDACRERKVRCDRQHPTCGRCARLSHACNYSGPSKQAASKVDLSQLLMTLHSRLTQAEARLALSSPVLDMNQFIIPWSNPGVAPVAASGEAASAPQFSPTQMQESQSSLGIPVEGLSHSSVVDAMMLDSRNEWFNQLPTDTSTLQFNFMAPTIPIDFSMAKPVPDVNEFFETNPISDEPSPSSRSDFRSQNVSTISASVFSRLYASFFDVFYPVMPIVNQSRFHAEMAQASYTIEVQALSHAIGALGALAMPEFAHVHEFCYNQARNLLDMCERQENGGTLININTLQTCVLLTLYEFKRTNFARAWMTLGRAIRLCKMMGLDRIDDHSTTAEDSGLHVPLPAASNPAELEERYRTFWLLYVFDVFAAIRANSVPAIDETQIVIPLPCPGELPNITEASNMPSLHQVSELSENTRLSSFAGTIIMISLYRRCFDHIRSSLRQAPSYPFWVTHYRIDKSIRDCRNNLLTQHLFSHNPDDPLSLTLQMNLAAVEICLHEPAIAKVEQEQLPAALSTEAITRCQYAATETMEAVRCGQQLMGKNLEAFRQSSLFFIWPITMAIQACLRMLSYGESNISTHISSLRTLSNAMSELIDAEHVPLALLEKVDREIAKAERPKTKRKRT